MDPNDLKSKFFEYKSERLKIWNGMQPNVLD